MLAVSSWEDQGLTHVHRPTALFLLIPTMMLEVAGFCQLFELFDLLQKPFHFLVRLLSVRFLPLEETLSHQDGKYAWEDEQVSNHRKISRQVLDVAELHDEAADEGFERERKGWDDWVREHASD